jgi:hypothetical protein
MTITFENENDFIVYALEKVISYARRTQQIFVAHCAWWIASVIGLEQGLVIFIDNLESRNEVTVTLEEPEVSPARNEAFVPLQSIGEVHPDRVSNILQGRSVSAVPRDLTEDQRLDRILDRAERVIQESFGDRSTVQRNRVNPLPATKTQLKKARKARCLQEARTKLETDSQERLRQIRVQVIERLSKDDLLPETIRKK